MNACYVIDTTYLVRCAGDNHSSFSQFSPCLLYYVYVLLIQCSELDRQGVASLCKLTHTLCRNDFCFTNRSEIGLLRG